jgi:hypothetical protein
MLRSHAAAGRPIARINGRNGHRIECSEPLTLTEDVGRNVVLGSKLDQQLTDRVRSEVPEVIAQLAEAGIASQE